MAVFYKHIKGTGNATSNNDGLWTWIEWSKSSFGNQQALADYTPQIKVSGANGSCPADDDHGDQGWNLGHIITSNAINQKINESMSIPVLTTTNISNTTDNDDISITSTGNLFLGSNKLSFQDASNNLYFECFKRTGNTGLSISVRAPLNFEKSFSSQNRHIIFDPIEGKVQAVYFNATSDKRAKENIHPLLTNALNIIKKVQVYTFNLKSQPEEKMVGVIAQEFLDNKLDGVSLVANEAATGKDGDYMSIRESKLVYLLLKGIQEQQEQIEQLQKRITELESR